MSGAGSTWVARAPTRSASRYMRQLASHWSHKMTTRADAEEASVEFPTGARLEMRADPDTLDCALFVPADGDAGRMRDVVEEHLNRFAFREGPLTFDWREAG